MKTFKEYYNKNWSYDGQSALCIYGIYTGNTQGSDHPYDPDDLTRCFQCLRFITGNEHIQDWKKLILMVCERYPKSKKWRFIYDHFDAIYKSYFIEYDSEQMPMTYKIMQKA